MAKFKVYFQPIADMSIEVEADDVDAAIDEAYQERPQEVCGSCAGAWPRQKHSLELNMDGADAYLVTDEDGDEVWQSKTYIEELHTTVEELRKRIAELESAKA